MRGFLKRQLAAARDPATGRVDVDAFVRVVEQTYKEIDRERTLNDRAFRLMEEELLESNARLEQESAQVIETLIGNIREGIIVTTPDGSVLSVNAAARRMFDLPEGPEGEVADLRLERLIMLDENDAPAEEKVREAMGITVGGRRFVVEASINDYRTHGENRLLWIVRDISERKAKEEALQAAKESAEEANRLKSQFLATMSHELRTPLNAILGFSEVIRDQTFGADAGSRYRDYASDIFLSGTHLLELINDILDLSKIEAGGYVLNHETLDLSEIAGECVAAVQTVAQKQGISLKADLPDARCPLVADRRSARQIFLNLLSNAIKFTPAGGTVTLRLEARQGGYTIIIEDTGIGIEDGQLPHLFEPFRQADETIAREYGGTGLGLAITKKLVAFHSGTIQVNSEPGAGTTVRVDLPDAEASVVAISAD